MHVQTLAVCTSTSHLLAVSGVACTQRVLNSLSCFTSVTSKETDEDLYFNSEEHLQRIPKPRAVLGRCSSGSDYRGTPRLLWRHQWPWAGSLEIPVQTMCRQHWGWW